MRYAIIAALMLISCPPATAQWISHEIDLPSDAAGGGTLALTVYEPLSARYPEGAPVVVEVDGGTSWGSLSNPMSDANGIVQIAFLLPGGSSGGRSSGGTWDDRGSDSILAVRDVIRYAGGQLTDDDGLTLADTLSVTPLSDQVGLIGLSNGGNLVIVTPSLYGPFIDDILRWVVQWESPVSSQAAVSDNSKVALSDCPVGVSATVGLTNPRYLAYGPLELSMNFSDLSYNASDPYFRLFHDGNGDGVYSTVADPASGCLTPDLNLNGALELNEDYPLKTFTDGSLEVYSRPVTQALHDSGLLSGGWPSDLDDLSAATAYWSLREAVRHYRGATAAIPGLEGMVLCSREDHVQGDPGRFHIRQAFEGWDHTGAWVRINPDPTYVLEVDSTVTGPLPDNPPNTAPPDWSSPLYTYPESISNEIVQTAAVYEMADRARVGIFRDSFESGNTLRWSAAVP